MRAAATSGLSLLLILLSVVAAYARDDGAVRAPDGAYRFVYGTGIPTIQIGVEGRLPWLGKLDSLPGRSPREAEKIAPYLSSIRSLQHPDHDTKVWPEGA